MSFVRRSARINNENEAPADLLASRPGKVRPHNTLHLG
jgi:hypothetical protein